MDTIIYESQIGSQLTLLLWGGMYGSGRPELIFANVKDWFSLLVINFCDSVSRV